MELNAKQQEAVERAIAFYERGEPGIFSVSGLAGTGKTVALSHIVTGLIERGMSPAVTAPTGKAARVISEKAEGKFAANTMHSVLTTNPKDQLKQVVEQIVIKSQTLQGMSESSPSYAAIVESLKELRLLQSELEAKKENTLRFEPIDPDMFHAIYDGLIVDEASMVGRRDMYEPFMRPIKCPVIAFGDHGQLPPINDDPAIDLENADVVLTEVLRQAEGSGIIKLAHSIRQSNRMDTTVFDEYDDLIALDQIDDERVFELGETHQVLVWKNDTRHHLNWILRDRVVERLGNINEKRPHLPMIGETLLFDSNNKERGIFKGMPFKVRDIHGDERYERRSNLYQVFAEVEIPNGTDDPRIEKITLGLNDLVPKQFPLYEVARDDKDMRMDCRRGAVGVMFPYALTVHKAQGSEWPNVLVIGEMPSRISQYREWLYTAATRARDELVIMSDLYFKKPKRAKPTTMADVRKRIAKVK